MRESSPKLHKLYRPVGQKELDLIIASGWREFPARLSHQPIFYPVENYPYAAQIARDWNTKDPNSGFVGYVTCFEMDAKFLSKYPIQKVGNEIALEYWIPAEELSEFNRQIIGLIRVLAEFRPI